MPYDNVEAPLRVSIVGLTLDVSNTVQTHCADAMFCVKILRSVLTILLVVQTFLFGRSFSLGLLCSYLSCLCVMPMTFLETRQSLITAQSKNFSHFSPIFCCDKFLLAHRPKFCAKHLLPGKSMSYFISLTSLHVNLIFC